MRILTLLIFISLSGIYYAQEPAVLFSKLKNAQSDTQKINTLNALTKLYLDISLDSAAIFNQQSISASSAKKNEKFSYKGIYYKAYIARKQKKYNEALEIAQSALNLAKKNKNKSDEANALTLMKPMP